MRPPLICWTSAGKALRRVNNIEVLVGQLYNGCDLPPFSAGEDSGVNHPGVLSGLHTHALDGSGYNQWVLDDATGQRASCACV